MLPVLALSLALAASPAKPQFCQDEQQPVGSALGVGTAADDKQDLNVVTKVSKVVRADYPARTIGYVVRIANGNAYYETRPAPLLTAPERALQAKVLLTPGLVIPPKHAPVDRNYLREAAYSSLSMYFPIHYDAKEFARNGLRVVHCTPRGGGI